MFCIRLEDEDGFLSYFNGYQSSLRMKANYKTDQMVLFDNEKDAQTEADLLQRDKMSIQEILERFLEDYETLKQRIKELDPHEYERWKAGGFIVDNNIVSMYPNIEDVCEGLFDDEDDEEFEDEYENDEELDEDGEFDEDTVVEDDRTIEQLNEALIILRQELPTADRDDAISRLETKLMIKTIHKGQP